ncbi:MAG: DEAD/DEAH box helicase [Bacillota bacterium]|nr:DEAD/DEAH box helicase [Bacillota bacterium]
MIKKQDLIENNYYINTKYGIGQYKRKETFNNKIQYCFLYAQGTHYYADEEHLNEFYRYNYIGNNTPKLDSIRNKNSWKKRKNKSIVEAKKQANELLQIYKNRSNQEGFKFSKDTCLQKQFESSISFELSSGQKRCINEIKLDMESNRTMDRLLCGDVGYGKTELAMRAAFKAIQDHKQVIILTPSKILSGQHYSDFKDRFKNYDVKIALLTSQRNKKRTQLLQEIELGEIDIIIGTQNVLSYNIHYKDLGLMVIDEEHKFGVSTKDKIKKISSNIDILSMTGTPIPRTLNLTKLNIRNVSIIDTPPLNKKAPITESYSWNDNKIKFVINRELKRGGQIFVVDNNIKELYILKDKIETLVPNIKIAIVHGKMKADDIDNIMLDVLDKKYDLILASTVIEVGITVKNANTMIIFNAQNMGLAQLHQLRGRVGRSNNNIESYCILTYSNDKILDPIAKERLQIMCKNSCLGSGFKISERDAEIRGFGEIIGTNQSGHIANGIGMDYYIDILGECIKGIS